MEKKVIALVMVLMIMTQVILSTSLKLQAQNQDHFLTKTVSKKLSK